MQEIMQEYARKYAAIRQKIARCTGGGVADKSNSAVDKARSTHVVIVGRSDSQARS